MRHHSWICGVGATGGMGAIGGLPYSADPSAITGRRTACSTPKVKRDDARAMPLRGTKTVRRTGFTLVELMVSMSVATLLLGGVVSAITLASRAIPDADSPLRATTKAYHAAERMAEELFVAQSFAQRSATMVEFTVADRDSDTVAEIIRYQWSAVPGDPLTRQFNGGVLGTVLDDVYKFDLSYTTKQQSATTTTTVTSQGSETELASFDNWAGIMPTQFVPAPDRWMAQYLQILPPSGATSVSITRVKLMMWYSTFDPAATVSVAIHRPQTLGSPQPQSAPIGTPAVQLTSSLSASPAWTDYIFSDVVIDPADTQYVIVVKATNLGTVKVRYYYWKSAPSDSHILITSTDAGASWDPRASAHDDNDMPFYVYGEAQTQTSQEITTTKYWMQSVNIALRTGSDAQSEVQTAAQVLNKPEVTGP